jgi:hypothetical protein
MSDYRLLKKTSEVRRAKFDELSVRFSTLERVGRVQRSI